MKTLAEQVGEEVMGYTMKWVDGSDWNEPAPEVGWRVLIADDDDVRFEWAPDTNVNDWWELVEKVQELTPIRRYVCFEMTSRGEAFAFMGGRECVARTLFEATCRVALKVVRGE